MFDSIQSRHEEIVRDYLETGNEAGLAEISGALIICHQQLVNALKSEEHPDARRMLKTLYEGLANLADHLKQSPDGAGIRNEFRQY